MLSLLVVSSGVGAGCRGRGGDQASCGAAAAKFLEIAKYDLAAARVDGRGSAPAGSAAEGRRGSIDEASSRRVTDQLPAMRDALAQACTEGKWSETIRGCLVRANDHIGFETCEQQLTDEQRRDLGRGLSLSPAPTEAPSPSHPAAPHGNLDPAH